MIATMRRWVLAVVLSLAFLYAAFEVSRVVINAYLAFEPAHYDVTPLVKYGF